MIKDTIIHGDCSRMDKLPSGSIDLIVSGPPYWEYIDYSAFINKRPFTWTGSSSYNEFMDKMAAWYAECYRALRPGRYCIVNVGTLRKNGICYPLPFHCVSALEKLGFHFNFEIIWHKISGGRQHARVFIQHPYPGYYLPNNRIEYLLVFRKEPRVPFYSDPKKQKTEENRLNTDDFFTKELANNVWHIMPPHSKEFAGHPCPFPPEIPYRLIQYFSLKGELVLDPFMGIGTTARAARMLGRHYIGYEIQKDFIDAANKLIDTPLRLRRPTMCGYVTYSHD